MTSHIEDPRLVPHYLNDGLALHRTEMRIRGEPRDFSGYDLQSG